MSKQLNLALSSPAEHGDFVHGVRRHTVLVWQPQAPAKKWTKVAPEDDLTQILDAHIGKPARYITVNQFHGWRSVRLLRSLQACFVDIDNCTDWEGVLAELSGLGLPSPSLVVESGRGLHFYWRLVPTPSRALPVWQAVQDELIRKLAPYGADFAARDCARVLGLIGSVNAKNNEVVRGRVLSPQEWTLHELADEVLGPRKMPERGQVIGMERARSKRQASVHQRTGPYRLWHQRYQDLSRIAEHHAFMRPSGVAEGSRDKLLFLLSVALSWFTSADGLLEHIQRLAKTYMPTLSERDVLTYTQTIVAGAIDAQRGEKKPWNGQMKDPRYEFRTTTLRRWLGNLITPELEPQLIALGPPKSAAERALIRAEQKAEAEKGRSRVQEGRYSCVRGEYIAIAAERSRKAQDLRQRGLSLRAIAAELKVSKTQIERYLTAVPCAPVLV